MKFAVFDVAGAVHIGLVKGGRVISATSAIPGLPTDTNQVIGRFEEFREQFRALESSADGWLALEDVHLRSPVSRPGKILAIGLNYADHIAEAGRETPTQQIWFIKASSSINGPFDPIQVPKASPNSLDYEAELVAVIGRGGRHISRADAPASVIGFAVGNDVSVREWQSHSPQWSLAKSFDTHSPIGPWITLTDEAPDPHGLDIKAVVNGVVRQHSNTANLVFDVWDQIVYLSQAMTLEPGDVIFTGTPGGVGWLSEPRFVLSDGDVVRIEIDKLGYIEGVCKDE